MSSTVHHFRLALCFLALLCITSGVTEAENLVTFRMMEAEHFEKSNSESCICASGDPKCSCACRNFFSVESLSVKSNMFPPCKEFELRLEHSVLPFLPYGLFSNIVQPTRLHLKIHNSTVYLLDLNTETHSSFPNLSFEKIDISIQKSLTLAGWNWDVFHRLFLTHGGQLSFNAVKSELLYLPDEFSSAAKGEICAVRIFQCRLLWLGKTVFAPLHKLHTLELRNNLLKDITRSQLPQLPSELQILDLGNNRLSHIPHDLLEGLPLNTFYIDKNFIKCLEASIMIRLQAFGISELNQMPVCKTNTTDAAAKYQRDQYEGVPPKSVYEEDH